MDEWLERLRPYFEAFPAREWFLISLAAFVVTFLGSILATGWVLLRLPDDYFLSHRPLPVAQRHPVWRWTGLILKNLVGIVLLGMGLVMLVTPGQGLLTILIGLLLVNFPGKRRLEERIVTRPAVLGSINRLRLRFGRGPLIAPQSDARGEGKETPGGPGDKVARGQGC